jgi:hypothetical protein
MSGSSLFGLESDPATEAAIDNPQPGDRWHEMYSWWLYVIAVAGDKIVTAEGLNCRRFIEKAEVKILSKEGFRKYLSYDSGVSGYWMMLCDRGNDVTGWWRDAPDSAGLKGGV